MESIAAWAYSLRRRLLDSGFGGTGLLEATGLLYSGLLGLPRLGSWDAQLGDSTGGYLAIQLGYSARMLHYL